MLLVDRLVKFSQKGANTWVSNHFIINHKEYCYEIKPTEEWYSKDDLVLIRYRDSLGVSYTRLSHSKNITNLILESELDAIQEIENNSSNEDDEYILLTSKKMLNIIDTTIETMKANNESEDSIFPYSNLRSKVCSFIRAKYNLKPLVFPTLTRMYRKIHGYDEPKEMLKDIMLYILTLNRDLINNKSKIETMENVSQEYKSAKIKFVEDIIYKFADISCDIYKILS